MLDMCATHRYYAQMVAPVEAPAVVSVVLNGVPALQREHHASVRQGVLAVHVLVREGIPELLGIREMLIAVAEVFVACSVMGIVLPKKDVAEASGSSVKTLNKYIARIVTFLSQEAAVAA